MCTSNYRTSLTMVIVALTFTGGIWTVPKPVEAQDIGLPLAYAASQEQAAGGCETCSQGEWYGEPAHWWHGPDGCEDPDKQGEFCQICESQHCGDPSVPHAGHCPDQPCDEPDILFALLFNGGGAGLVEASRWPSLISSVRVLQGCRAARAGVAYLVSHDL